MDQNVTGTCGSCAYWKHNPDAPTFEQTKIAGAKGRKLETGFCYYGRPAMMSVPRQGAVAGSIVMEMQRIFPVMIENEFCADHPERRHAREYALARAAEAGRRNLAEFSPQKYGDAHAGFNAAPSLTAAKKIAVTFQQCAHVERGSQCILESAHAGEHVCPDQRKRPDRRHVSLALETALERRKGARR